MTTKPRHVEADDDRRLAELLHPGSQGLERVGRGARAADDLDDLDELRRVEEVEAGEALGPLQLAAHLVDRERRRVGGQDRAGRRELLGPREDRALRLDLLDDGLDDELGARERLVEIGGHRDGLPCPLARGLQALLAPSHEADRRTPVREDARDSGTHGSGADDRNFTGQGHSRRLTERGSPECAT